MENPISHKEENCWQKIGVFGDGSCPLLDEYAHCRHCPEYSKAGRNLLDRRIPESFRKEWQESLSKKQKQTISETVSYLVFRLNSEWFGLKTYFFEEAVETRRIHSIPFRSGKLLSGIVNINGELLLCMNPAALLDLGSSINSEKGIMLVVSYRKDRYVFPVQEILGIFRIEPEKIKKPPSTVSKSVRSFTSGTYTVRNENIGLIDEKKLFNSLERSFIWQ